MPSLTSSMKIFLRSKFSELKFQQSKIKLRGHPVWIAYGDSLTSFPLTNTIGGRCGFITKNLGLPGSRVSLENATAMSSDARLRAIPRRFDLLTIMGGTNDWRGNVPIGQMEDDDPSTFLGGYRAVLRRIRSINGDATVLLLSPPHAEAPEFRGAATVSGDRNRLGLTIGDYAAAVAALAEQQGIELLDLHRLCDFQGRMNDYYDDGDRIHFNRNGLEAIARHMEQRFRLLGAPLPRNTQVVNATLRGRGA